MIEQMMAQMSATEERYRDHEAERDVRQQHLNSLGNGGDWTKVDSPERVLERVARLGFEQMAGEALEALAESPREENAPLMFDTPPMLDVFERIIGKNDLIGTSFILQGAQVARSVGRIVIRSPFGILQGYGTGFMVSPQLLLTNNHVLGSPGEAAHSSVQFNFYTKPDGIDSTAIAFAFQPDVFFLTSESLDFTLVAVEPTNADGVTARSRSWNPLIEQTGKVIVGERVNVIQHPGGQPQQLALRENQIVDLLEEFVHYVSDTRQGSSGSPVLNDQWELVGLHHAGVPERDDQKRILLRSGDPWDGGGDTVDQVSWIANEGVRVSRIVAHIRARFDEFTAEQRCLFDETALPRPMLEEMTQAISSTANRASELLDAGPTVVTDGSAAGSPVVTGGSLIWSIPLRIQVSLGDQPPVAIGGYQNGPVAVPTGRPTTALAGPVSGMFSPATLDTNAWREARERVRSFADKVYYDSDRDEVDRKQYYASIATNLRTGTRFRRLRDLLAQTHTNQLSYSEARLDYLYPWVDLHEICDEQRQLRSIYSGVAFDAEVAIRGDLEIATRREGRLREVLLTEGSFGEEAMEAALDELESQMPYNCEHVVPQSWFAKAQPMRGDLHHLFACEPGCNSFRSNIPYFQFDPVQEVYRSECGRREMDKFEPDNGKGAVARASLYFLLRYPRLVGDDKAEMQLERLPMLLDWHQSDPVSLYEKHRNAAIFAIQGNRNPLIDYPQWAEKIDFTLGFAGG
jgi:V8-like Glu-specific endopeptidase